MLVEAVHDGNAKVVVHDVVAAADRKLVFLAQNLGDPSVSSVRRPSHRQTRREILVVPIPQGWTVILRSAQDERDFPGMEIMNPVRVANKDP